MNNHFKCIDFYKHHQLDILKHDDYANKLLMEC